MRFQKAWTLPSLIGLLTILSAMALLKRKRRRRLSNNFDLSEFGDVPARYMENLEYLVNEVLQPARDESGAIIITSGYRDPKCNSEAGGVKNSRHLTASAADFKVGVGNKYTNAGLFEYIKKNLPFDELILYRPGAKGYPNGGIHVSVNRSKFNRYFSKIQS